MYLSFGLFSKLIYQLAACVSEGLLARGDRPDNSPVNGRKHRQCSASWATATAAIATAIPDVVIAASTAMAATSAAPAISANGATAAVVVTVTFISTAVVATITNCCC